MGKVAAILDFATSFLYLFNNYYISFNILLFETIEIKILIYYHLTVYLQQGRNCIYYFC